jgi:hypothetical protein
MGEKLDEKNMSGYPNRVEITESQDSFYGFFMFKVLNFLVDPDKIIRDFKGVDGSTQ